MDVVGIDIDGATLASIALEEAMTLEAADEPRVESVLFVRSRRKEVKSSVDPVLAVALTLEAEVGIEGEGVV